MEATGPIPRTCPLVEELEGKVFGNGISGEIAELKATSQDNNAKLGQLLRIVKGDEETDTPGLMKRMKAVEDGTARYRQDRVALKWIAVGMGLTAAADGGLAVALIRILLAQ